MSHVLITNPPAGTDFSGGTTFPRTFNDTCGLYGVTFHPFVGAGGGPDPHLHLSGEQLLCSIQTLYESCGGSGGDRGSVGEGEGGGSAESVYAPRTPRHAGVAASWGNSTTFNITFTHPRAPLFCTSCCLPSDNPMTQHFLPVKPQSDVVMHM